MNLNIFQSHHVDSEEAEKPRCEPIYNKSDKAAHRLGIRRRQQWDLYANSLRELLLTDLSEMLESKS